MRIDCDKSSPYVWRLQLHAGERDKIVLSAEGLLSLLQILTDARQDPNCRILILEGSSGDFCQGMDLDFLLASHSEEIPADIPAPEASASQFLQQMQEKFTQSPLAMPEGIRLYAELLHAMRRAPQLIISSVDGTVFAGGVGIVAASDICIATSKTTFGLSEITLGLLPAMVLPFLYERMPPQKARFLALSGQSIDAQKAYQLGLIDILTDDDNEKPLRRLLRQLLRAHPQAIADLKRLSLDMQEQPLATALKNGMTYTIQSLDHQDRIDGIQHFLEGEPLPWFQRYRTKDKKR